MPNIRPISDLRNNFAEISKIVNETREPVFLTKNGYGDMVVMSTALYQDLVHESEIYIKLKEAELAAKNSDVRLSHDEVFSEIRKIIK